MKHRIMIYVLFIVAVFVGFVDAHCDSMKGPVIPEAQMAIEKGDITPILKWIKPEYESEIKEAFELTRQVRKGGSQAKELADKYFLETLIRLHRAGEGASYTGIKDSAPEKIIVLSDQALSDGSVDELIEKIQIHLAAAVREKFEKVLHAAKQKDQSVGAGRRFVEAYVQYTHFVEGIHTAILSTGNPHDHAQEPAKSSTASQVHEH